MAFGLRKRPGCATHHFHNRGRSQPLRGEHHVQHRSQLPVAFQLVGQPCEQFCRLRMCTGNVDLVGHGGKAVFLGHVVEFLHGQFLHKFVNDRDIRLHQRFQCADSGRRLRRLHFQRAEQSGRHFLQIHSQQRLPVHRIAFIRQKIARYSQTLRVRIQHDVKAHVFLAFTQAQFQTRTLLLKARAQPQDEIRHLRFKGDTLAAYLRHNHCTVFLPKRLSQQPGRNIARLVNMGDQLPATIIPCGFHGFLLCQSAGKAKHRCQQQGQQHRPFSHHIPPALSSPLLIVKKHPSAAVCTALPPSANPRTATASRRCADSSPASSLR